jgi:integrase/recombinase XerD
MNKEDADKYLQKTAVELKLRGASQRTIESYTFFLRPYLSSIKDPLVSDTDEVKFFLASLIERYSNKSRALASSALRFFYKRVIDRPHIVAKIETPKKERYLPVVLSPTEVVSLIEAADTKKSRLMIKMLYGSGLRVSELVNLKPGDLDFKEMIGTIRKGKGSKDRIFKMSEDIAGELKDYIIGVKDRAGIAPRYLFSEDSPLTTRNIQKIIQRTSRKAGIAKRVTPHTLRHSFATHLLDAGENIVMIQQLLGHENLETTRIYTHISQEQIKKVKSPLDMLNKKV